MDTFASLSPPQLIGLLIVLALGVIIIVGILKRVLHCIIGLVVLVSIVAVILMLLWR